MLVSSKDVGGRSGEEHKGFFDRLRSKFDPGDKTARGVHRKLPPIADIVARTGRPMRDKP